MSTPLFRSVPLLLCAALPAQVAPGHVVGAHFYVGSIPGLGGLYVHHPTGAVPAVPISGLRSDLTGSIASGTQFCGANAIAAVDTAGTTFYVGEMTDDNLPASWSVNLHEVVVRFVPGSGYVGTDRVVATLNTVPGPVPNSPQRQISGMPSSPAPRTPSSSVPVSTSAARPWSATRRAIPARSRRSRRTACPVPWQTPSRSIRPARRCGSAPSSICRTA